MARSCFVDFLLSVLMYFVYLWSVVDSGKW